MSELLPLVKLNNRFQWVFGCVNETQVYLIAVYETLEKRLE